MTDERTKDFYQINDFEVFIFTLSITLHFKNYIMFMPSCSEVFIVVSYFVVFVLPHVLPSKEDTPSERKGNLVDV